MGLAAAVLSGFALSLAAPWLARVCRGALGWVVALLPLGLTALFAGHLDSIAAGRPPVTSLPWAPSLGVELAFRMDGLSALFALLVSGVGALVMVFSGGYLAGHPRRGRFFAFLLAFMASMLGVALADDLVTLFVFWELTSLGSFFLIGFHHEEAESRAAAWQALLVTAGGGLCLLAGFLLLGIAGDSLRISVLLGRGDAVRAHPLHLPALALILIGAATKSAQLPFHFWLPAAMAAPAPVSAYLHSATMVKAGVYLLARLHPVLGGTAAWEYGVTSVGAATMLAGAYLAWQQTDLKRILAYSTVSTLGMLVMLVGWGTEGAIGAAITYFVVHSAYKGALFLVAGSVDHSAGTRDVDRLGGLGRSMPLTAAAAGLAALSMIGLPPLLGFTGKELVYGATLGAPVLLGAAVAANIVNVVVAFLAAFKPFFGPPEAPKEPHEAPPSMWLGPAVLAAAGLALGLGSRATSERLVSPAAAAALGRPVHVDLSLSHGLSLRHGDELNVALILGAVTLLAGAAAYAGRRALRRAVRPLEVVLRFGPARGYEVGLRGLLSVAAWQTRLLQGGRLRHHLSILLVTTILFVGAALMGPISSLDWGGGPAMEVHEWAVAALVLGGTVVVARSRSRLLAVVALGVVGYGVALLFVLFGAPDLAMTQLAIETLSVVLLVLVLYRLPRFKSLSSGPARIRDVLLASAGGGVMALLVLMVTVSPAPSRLTPYFAENSVPLGHGRNVVNVILVDFRALDTLGEITVLAAAALGGHALLELGPERRR